MELYKICNKLNFIVIVRLGSPIKLLPFIIDQKKDRRAWKKNQSRYDCV